MAGRTSSGPLAEQQPRSGGPGAVGWAALAVAVYGAAMGTLAFTSRGGGGGSSGTRAPDDLDARLAAHASALRSELQDDFRKQVKQAEDTFVRAERRIDETRTTVQKVVDDGRRVAENAVRASSDHAETVETKIREVAEQTGKLSGTVETLQATVKELERRPVATAPRPGPTAPAPAPAPVPKAPDAAPEGPSAEEVAAQKAKVEAAIAALASPEIGKVFPACVTLGKLGDLSAVDPLVKVLKDHKDPYAKTAAAAALGALHACDAVPALLQAILDRDDGVTLAAAQAIGKIAGIDAGMTGSPTRKERNDARERLSKWWSSNEAEVRTRWNQPKAAAGGGEPAGK